MRLQPGKFFALAQSPQIFKQLCMVGGFDRYYQIATCWRDEDLRADRQFEFRQLDLEMAFAEREDVLDVMETAVVASFEALGREAPSRPFPRISFDEAMTRYGSDKPDLRFGLEIQDATAVTRDSEFGVFANAEAVRFIVAPKAFSRSEIQRLEELAKEWGAKGLAYVVVDEAGEVRSPIAKFLSPAELAAARGASRIDGALRRRERRRRRPRPRPAAPASRPRARPDRPELDVFHWVLDFPLFEQDEETGAWTFMHHPFTAPVAGAEVWDEADPADVRGQHYDLVWNGWELGSGSIRIHDVELQQRVFRTIGLTEEEAQLEVRLPARRARDGRTAARWLRDGDRAVRRADGGRAGHPPGDRLPEGLERIRSAHRRADPDAGRGAARARRAGCCRRKAPAERSMPDRRGSRFVLEVLFLVGLAVALTLAKLDALEIGGVMLLGWLIVAILEWAAWRGEPHYGSGLPPRYYVPNVNLPPAQPLEQVRVGYPEAHRDEAPTWIASAALRAEVLGDWPHAAPAAGTERPRPGRARGRSRGDLDDDRWTAVGLPAGSARRAGARAERRRPQPRAAP